MKETSEIVEAIKRFVDRPREGLADRIKKFASKAQERWGASDVSVLPPEEKVEWSPLLEFFAPLGYRPLFEQEIVFLMDEGLAYEDILQMPVYLRKKLIDRKIAAQNPQPEEEGGLPPSMLEQIRLARQHPHKATPQPQGI